MSNRIKEKDLSKVHVESNKSGFTVWISDPKSPIGRHWLLDASCLYEDGQFRVAEHIDTYAFNVQINGRKINIIETDKADRKILESKNKVDKVIDSLMSRGGFDDWWHNIDEETQSEIRVEIESIINEQADNNYALAH